MVKTHSILIGNGFNLALREACNIKQINFGYEEILAAVIKKIKDEDKCSDLVSYLSQSNLNKHEKISDIELLLWILKYSKECIKYCNPIYCNPKKNFEALLERHRKLLKDTVIEIMTNQEFHPPYKTIFNMRNTQFIEKCGHNLKKFKKIFTTNYDLILYWLLNNQKLLILHNPEDCTITGQFKDGFTSQRAFKAKDHDENIIDNLLGYSSTNNTGTLLFLHGALHLLQKDNDTFKIITANSDKSLQNLKIELLDNYKSFENLIVFDATSNEKVNHIYNNNYLRKAYDKLAKINDDLVIYGCSIFKPNTDELGNDSHLWLRIINSDVKNIYIGVDKELEDFEFYAASIIKALIPYKNTDSVPKLHLYTQKNINIWNSDDFYNDVINISSKEFPIE